ncbi:hypothetical protein [Streptomyces sp. NPDC006285]|uniref:hypothetical protein n=1 Tax=Streptomyces sp. NPDC006285 TaxID=3364742 RepID=UPI0036CD10DE
MRHARLYRDGKDLVLRDRHLRERRYPCGDGGIIRAVFVPPPGGQTQSKGSFTDRRGVVSFEGGDGRPILRVPLAEWLPEAGLVGLMSLSPSACLERSGLRRLVTDAGIPLQEGTEPEQPEKDRSGSPDRAVNPDLPVWHGWARGLGILVWFVFFLVFPLTDNGNAWTAVVAAAGLFLVPGSDLAVRFKLSRARHDDLLAHAAVVVPAPEAGADVTRRFLDTTAVRVMPKDVVLTNTLGEERWIPRGGTCGVTRLVRLTDPATGAVLGVEFRDGANAPRALLPWRWWFAGPHGSETWSRLVSALAAPVSDEKVRGGRQPDPWWQHHELSADIKKMSPMSAKEARSETSWHSSVIGGNEPIVIPVFCLLLLPGLASDQATARAAGVLTVLTLVASLAPVLQHHLTSRRKLDRPVAADSP